MICSTCDVCRKAEFNVIKKGPMKVGLYGMWHKLGMCTYHKQHRGGKKKYKIIIKRKKKKMVLLLLSSSSAV